MIFNLREAIYGNSCSIPEQIILNGLEGSVIKEVAEDPTYREHGTVELRMTVNGHEVDPEPFCTHWMSCVDDAIATQARVQLEEHFRRVTETLYETEQLLMDRLKMSPTDRQASEYGPAMLAALKALVKTFEWDTQVQSIYEFARPEIEHAQALIAVVEC